MDPHQLLPHAPDAEKALLGSWFYDHGRAAREVGCICVDKGITPEHFHIPAHQLVFAALRKHWLADLPCDFISITQALRDSGELEPAGGVSYVTDLGTLMPTAATAGYYADILEEKRALRSIIRICTEHAGRSYAEQDDFPGILADLQSQIFALGVQNGRKVPTMKENVLAVVSALQGAHSGDSPNLIRTGLKAIDEDVGPLERGNLLVVAGQGKSGKSQLAGQIALNMAFNGQPALYISLEMTEREVTARWLASMARVNTRTPRLWADADYDRFDAAKTRILDLPLTVLCGLTELPEVVGAVRQHAAKPGAPLGAVILDYAQLLSSPSKRKDDRKSREIADISQTCKRLAVRHNLLFVLLSQLNDEGRSFESRAIEHDANLMLEVGHNESTGERGVKVVLARSAPMGQRLGIRIIPENTRVEDCELTDEPEEHKPNEHQRKTHRNGRSGASRSWNQD